MLTPQNRSKHRGFALLVMLVLLVTSVLYFVVNNASSVALKAAQQNLTLDTLNQAKQALIGYAATYSDTHNNQTAGYLPCPDMDGNGSANAVPGCGASGVTVIGLLPYKQLGLSSNLDSDGNCLWYAVSGTYKASGNPLPALNWDTQGQIQVRDASGNVVIQPNDSNGGAAAIIFSVGQPLMSQGRLSPTTTAPCGVSTTNHADVVYANYIDIDPAGLDVTRSQPFPSTANAMTWVAQGSLHSSINNDQILAITPKEIFAVVAKRNDFFNAGINAIGSQLQSNSPLTPPASGNNLPTTNPFTNPSTNYSFYRSWANNFRYLVCSPSVTYCYNINGVACDGVLIFAGQSTTTSPRPNGAPLSTYFEDAYLLTSGGTNSFSGNATNTSYLASNPSTDIVKCIAPHP